MSQPCSIEMCKYLPDAQCHCCQKNFCLSHLNEHANLPNLQLNPLVNEIDLLNARFMALTVDKLTGSSRQKLERWRIHYHKIIDDFFEEKYREIDRRANEKLEQQQNELAKVQSTATELLRKQKTTKKDIDSLEIDIHTVAEKINTVEQTCFEAVVRPLVIDDTLIRIEELYMPQLDLSSLPPPYKTIDHVDGSSRVITSNDRFFLIHQKSDLCLVDRESGVINRKQWDYGLIWDMCWSSTLNRFFIINRANVFTVDEKTMSVEPVPINQDQRWYSGTCSDTSLFLSTFTQGSSIWKFSLFSPVQLEDHWKSPETCAETQTILNVVHNNGTLALAIVSASEEHKRIELRSATTFERLWSFRLDNESRTRLTRCCFLNHGDLLAYNCFTSRLLHITADGKLKATSKYNASPLYITLCNGDQLAISTMNSINFHRINS